MSIVATLEGEGDAARLALDALDIVRTQYDTIIQLLGAMDAQINTVNRTAFSEDLRDRIASYRLRIEQARQALEREELALENIRSEVEALAGRTVDDDEDEDE